LRIREQRTRKYAKPEGDAEVELEAEAISLASNITAAFHCAKIPDI
jgi:hypothetical protein